MRIKIFESQEMNRSYTLVYPSMNHEHVPPYLENENHERIPVTMKELHELLDKFFKEKYHAINQEC